MNLKKLREDFPVLQKRINGKPIIYLDTACMALKPVQVVRATERYYNEFPACAGRSSHRLASEVSHAYDECRAAVAGFIGAKKSELIFTRNTTEGINLVANSFWFKGGDAVLTTDREHNSNLIPWQLASERRGIKHAIVESNADLTFSMENLQRALTKDVRLLAFVHSSNLDGYTLPVKEIIKAAHDNGSLVLLDAAQSVPHKELSVRKLDVDFLAFSGHKMLGPTGTGALYVKEEHMERLAPFMVGGDTVESTTYTSYRLLRPPERFEAGLQDYAGALGFAEAARYLGRIGKAGIERHERALNRQMTDGISGEPELRIIGPQDPGLRGSIVSFYTDRMDSHEISLILNNSANIMTRSGQHCVHSWFNAHRIKGSVRASFYLYNTKEEVDVFVETLRKIGKLA